MALERDTPEPLEWGIPEVASYLGVKVATVYRWRKYGKGPRGFRLGKEIRFRPSEVAAWAEGQREASRAS